jgi:kynurenine formamidase
MTIIDLTMPIDEKTPVYPGDPKQVIEQIATIKEDEWNEKRFTFNSHFSTHIDAPFHMIEDGKKLDEFLLETFIGKAIVIENNSDTSEVEEGDIVFVYTGNAENTFSESYFTNKPFFEEEFAKKLTQKKVKIVGIDSYSPDAKPFEIHKLFFKHNIPIVENLTNLKQLIGKRFSCTILPLKIKDADGAPCRVIAIV